VEQEKITVRGIPIDFVEIDAAQHNHGYQKASLIPDSQALLIASLDTVLARLWMQGLKPPFIQLAEYPFDRFVPVPIKITGVAVVTNPISKPVGLMGWLRVKRQIVIGTIG